MNIILDRAAAVVAEIKQLGGQAIAVQADVTDIGSVRSMVATAKQELGPIGVLVNDAGNSGADPTPDMAKPFWETGPQTWSKTLAVNLYGVMNCASAVVPDMIAANAPGRVITIISDAGR